MPAVLPADRARAVAFVMAVCAAFRAVPAPRVVLVAPIGVARVAVAAVIVVILVHRYRCRGQAGGVGDSEQQQGHGGDRLGVLVAVERGRTGVGGWRGKRARPLGAAAGHPIGGQLEHGGGSQAAGPGGQFGDPAADGQLRARDFDTCGRPSPPIRSAPAARSPTSWPTAQDRVALEAVTETYPLSEL